MGKPIPPTPKSNATHARRIEGLIRKYTQLRDWEMVGALFFDLGMLMERGEIPCES